MILHSILSGLSIVLIDLLLGGDNAVVIALAVRGLPRERRNLGITAGAGFAVLLRVTATFSDGSSESNIWQRFDPWTNGKISS